MIGVVVWTNVSREKAIIWCEDQATLAYLQGRANLVEAEGRWPEPGDLVELETQTIGNLRHALVVSILSEQSCPQLPRLLAESWPAAEARPRVVNLHNDQRQSVSQGLALPRMRTSAAG